MPHLITNAKKLVSRLKEGVPVRRENSNEENQDLLRSIRGLNFPVFVSNEMRVTAWPNKGASKYKAFVISIPKSGTYLVAELLTRLGMESVKLHLSLDYVTDYRFASLKDGRERPELFDVRMKFADALQFIDNGQFAVGHIECSELTVQLLRNFRKIFVFRNLRDALVSYMRFLLDTGRGGELTKKLTELPNGPEKTIRFMRLAPPMQVLISDARKQISWLKQEVLPVRFEDFYGDNGKSAQIRIIKDMSSLLGIEFDGNCDELLQTVIGSRTQTWSGKRSELTNFWDEKVESLFDDMGGVAVNRALGYD